MRHVKLKEIAEIIMGQSPEAEYVSTEQIGLPLLNGPAEFTEKYPIPVQYTSEKKRIAQPNDILFCVRGSTTGRMNIADQRYAIGRGLAAIRHKENSELNPYIKALIDVNLKKLLGGTLGSVFPNLTKDNLFELECYIHDEVNQQKIAAVLSALDDKIELNNRINAELEQMAKTLYDYWLVQFDFPDANGKPYKSSGGKMVYDKVLKKEIPEGWEVKRLGEIADANKKQISSRTTWDHISYLDTSNITNNNIHEIISLSVENAPSRAKRIVDIDDVIFSTVRPSQRHFGILKDIVENMVVSTGFTVLSHRTKRLFNNFIYSFLSSDTVVEYLHNIAQSSVSSYPSINPDDILNLFVCIPQNEFVLQSFSEKMHTFYQKIYSNQRQNNQLAALRDWLLPMLMNGQVKVMNVVREYSATEKQPALAAEPLTTYGELPKLNIPDSRKNFAKQVLAGKIVSEFKDDPNFTDIKFQKVQFLAEHIIEADLKLNYYYQAAGPYDNVFMHTIYNDFRKQKWFDCKNKQILPLEKQGKIDEYYQGYFAPVQSQLIKLFELMYQTTEAKAEIIATLYAVWNNRIIEKRTITDRELIQDFYQWSDRKQQYSEAQVSEGLQWLRTHQMEPKGFGKLIKKAKGKK